MLFKQIQLFQLTDSIRRSFEELEKNLEDFAFRPCLPSMASSAGWVSPIEGEETPLKRVINSCIMLCLQIEDKILPATVIRQELAKKIKQIETSENRKIRQKEKLNLKDEMIATLLPRAFTRLTRVYAYIDTKNNWLILGTANEKRGEEFLSLFKKSISENIHAFQFKKLSSTLTFWLKNQNYPSSFAIEKSCVLQDPNQQTRIIRCQQQDLFANSIQTLINDGCEVKHLAMNWQDRINFILSADNFSLRSIQYQDEIKQWNDMEAETKEHQFNADFYIMTETFSLLFKELLNGLMAEKQEVQTSAVPSFA